MALTNASYATKRSAMGDKSNEKEHPVHRYILFMMFFVFGSVLPRLLSGCKPILNHLAAARLLARHLHREEARTQRD